MQFLKFTKNLKKQFLVGMLILVVSSSLSFLLIKSKPSPKPLEQKDNLPLVETTLLKKVSVPIIINAQGKITASHVVNLRSEISGIITFKNKKFSKGGMVKKGEILLKIDQRDYLLTLAQRKSALSRAKLELLLEEANVKVAKAQNDRLQKNDDLSKEAVDLFLRFPHLEKAKAEKIAAKAEVAKAQLLLDKTIIKSPINALVSKANVNEGDFISNQLEMGIIIGTDEFLAEVSIPVADLAYLKFPKKNTLGSEVMITQVSKMNTVIKRKGVLEKLAPDLGSLGSMALLIISIPNPLKNEDLPDSLPMLPGALISAQITGNTLENVYEIPRIAFQDDDTIFVVEEGNQILKIKPLIIRREREFVYIKADFLPHYQVVLTKMPFLKEKDKVRIALSESK